MTKKYKFMDKYPDNYVHVLNEPLCDGFTLCAISIIDDFDGSNVDMIETNEKISCPDCTKLIKFCKSIRL